MQVFESPRNVLKSVPGLELLEFRMNQNLATCCGGGGGVMAFDSSMAERIAYKRVLEARDAGAEVIVSACPSCKRALQIGASRLRKDKKEKIQVMDITEVEARAL